MALTFDIGDNVKLTIRRKNKSSYIEIATDKKRFFISAGTWIQGYWNSNLDYSKENEVCIEYGKFLVRKANGDVVFVNTNLRNSCLELTVMEWYNIQDIYEMVTNLLEQQINNVNKNTCK